MKKKFQKNTTDFCISVKGSGERIASMKLGQRVKRVDYTGDMASKHTIVCTFQHMEQLSIFTQGEGVCGEHQRRHRIYQQTCHCRW